MVARLQYLAGSVAVCSNKCLKFNTFTRVSIKVNSISVNLETSRST